MHDLPRGAALLALARDVLVNDLLPLLPQERRLDALLVANCMAIAARETEAEGRTEPLLRELELLYYGAALTHPAPLSRNAGEGADPWTTIRGEAGEGAAQSLCWFARELRIGAFENSPEREALARAILWRMTIARLRLANPRFLAASGFA